MACPAPDGAEPAPRGFLLARFPIAWNHAIDKKSRQIKLPEQVLIEKVCQLFRNLL
jgi:hypothetical protein